MRSKPPQVNGILEKRKMTTELKDLLLTLEQFGHENDAREVEHRRKMLNLERDTALLMHILVRATTRRNILEIGTSNGYSTLWLADAIRHTPAGQITTIERDADKIKMARENIKRFGFNQLIHLMEGEASEIVQALSGPFDCVFFDADRISAPDQLQRLLPKLTPNVLLLCDNAISHPAEVAGYLSMVNGLPNFSTATVPVGKGLHIAFRQG